MIGLERWASAGKVAGVLLAGAACGGCGLLGPSTSHYTIRVDSLSAPAAVARTDTLRVRFFGFIGPDGCWSLASVDRQVTTSSLDVTFRGQHQRGGGIACTQMVVYLDRRESVAPPLGGPAFTITVHEPDGSKLTRTVAVQ